MVKQAAAVAGEARANALLSAIEDFTEADLAELDQAVLAAEATVKKLRNVRDLVRSALGLPSLKKPWGTKKKKGVAGATVPAEVDETPAASDPDRATKMLVKRKTVVMYLVKGPRTPAEIIQQCQVSPRWINELLNHEWFGQNNGRVHLTPKANREVVDA